MGDGTLLQWGEVTFTNQSNNIVYLPISFIDTNYFAVGIYNTKNGESYPISIWKKDNSSAYLYAGQSISSKVSWLAIGRWK